MAMANKPRLPTRFTQVSDVMGAYYLLHGLTLWVGGGLGGCLAWQADGLPLAVRVPIVGVLGLLSGAGMFFLALMGHEGFHGSLNRNRRVSMLMGIVASAVAPGFVSVGYNVIHWRHHLYTNTDKDPDYQLYRGNTTLLARLLHGPRLTMVNCLASVWKLVNGSNQLEKSYPFTPQQAKRYAWLNIVLTFSVLSGYACLAVLQPLLFTFLVLIPAVVSQSYWAITPYIEHAGTGVGQRVNARTCTSIVLRFLLLGYTYHLCHHLYPRVQLHRLPALFLYLQEIGYIGDEASVETSLGTALRIGGMGRLEF